MRSLVIASIISVFSMSAFATKFDLALQPTTPIVIDADGTDKAGNPIYGPWVQMSVVISNNSPEALTFRGISLTLNATDGSGIAVLRSLESILIVPGGSHVVDFTVDLLPPTQNYEYNGFVDVSGWVGTPDKQGPDTEESSLTFKTK